ncbi:uncharacterized protein [Excalfactoria chinensis]|uniref:uncharacterized protein n=1 Tax=Excalfactoria chinensis TaxID=46218 RepID=UPI003B3AAB68
MAGSPALLLLLSLGLCCTIAQGHTNTMEARFFDRNMKHPQQGQRVELECLHYERNRPIFWIHLDKSQKLHFIVSSTQSYSNTVQEVEKTSTNFEAIWRRNSPRLVVKSFSAQDQGTYFCVNFINQVLHFSSGQPAFFPVTTTAAPTIPAATTQCSQVTKKDIFWHSPDPAGHITPTTTTQSSPVTKRNSSQHYLDAGSSHENTPQFCHDTVIWVNLAGTCLLLLLTAITINITHCQSKSHPDTLQSFLEPHTTEHSPLLQGMGSLLIALMQPLAGHREC